MASGQHIRYLGTQEGLSSKQTIQTNQDKYGFIWIATKTGVDRFDGSNIKAYELPQIKSRYSYENYYLATDRDSLIWAYNETGQIFRFNYMNDKFELFQNINKVSKVPFIWIRYLHFTSDNNIFLATDNGLIRTSKKEDFSLTHFKNISGRVVCIKEVSVDTLLLATFNKIFLFSVSKDRFTELKLRFPESVRIQSLCYDKSGSTIWIGTFYHGVYSYDTRSKEFKNLSSVISDIPLVPIRALTLLNPNVLMVGSDGQGVVIVDLKTKTVQKLNSESRNENYKLSSNGVYDIFLDKGNRIWICTYAGGVNVFESGLQNFRTLKNILYNDQSIGNNGVNCIMEDSESNIWFGTNNGISILTNKNKWIHLFVRSGNEPSVFLAFCEDGDGNIWAATYSLGVFVINKNFQTTDHLVYAPGQSKSIGTNYVFSLFNNRNKEIWIGGRDGFVSKVELPSKKTSNIINIGVNSIIGSGNEELYMGGPQESIIYNTITNKINYLISGQYVNCLYFDGKENIYHGTRGNGMLVYNKVTKKIRTYTVSNGLSSNHINYIVPDGPYLWLSTENGLSRFDTRSSVFSNFFMGDGISDKTFNRSSGCKLKNGDIIFGSNNGVTWFDPRKIDEHEITAKIYLEELRLFNKTVYSGSSDSPLKTAINSTETLYLNHSQHSFSIKFVAISFFNSEKMTYKWKLNEFDQHWSIPSSEKVINYTNLPPGKYKLEIQVLDKALNKTLDKRFLTIIITPPFWETAWAKITFFIVFILIARWIFLYLKTKVDKKHSDDKISFFTNTAHDLRTPLTLVNAPLNELKSETNLSEKGKFYLNLTLSNVEKFNNLITQLLDFQKADTFKDKLTISETDVNMIMKEQATLFMHLAANKNIQLDFHPFPEPLFEWFDLTKMRKIVENLLSNAIKYTPDGGKIDLYLQSTTKSWTILIQDNGIGIPQKSQSKIFKAFYRGENAINSQIVGTGIGLLLTKNYVEIHHGKIFFQSNENLGTSFRLIFKHGYKHFPSTTNILSENISLRPASKYFTPNVNIDHLKSEPDSTKHKVLVVEDNEDLRNLLEVSLQNEFEVSVSQNGEEALERIAKNEPDVIVTDVIMPVMDGIELSKRLRHNFKTSHIPIIVLSALNEKENLFKAFDLGVDDYITKPFDISVLMVKIKNIITNRQILRKRILALTGENIESNTFANQLDQQFIENAIALIQRHIADSDFNIATFSTEMGVSKTILYDKFKALIGQPPNDFIKALRIKHAMKLLSENGKYTIAEVASLSGFDDPRYFSTCFKNIYGKSPSAYLK